MSKRIDVRLTFPEELSERLRRYTESVYSGQKGAVTLTVTQAVKEFLDKRVPPQPEIEKGKQ